MEMNISEIKIGKDRRPVSPEKVTEIAESVEIVGLLNSILVSTEKELIAGLHRIKAFEKLGRKTIPVTIFSHSGLKAELAELDENTARSEFTTLERCEYLKRRKTIYEQLYPGTKNGQAQIAGMNRAKNAETDSTCDNPPSFVKDTADKSGRSETAIKEDIRIAEGIDPEVKEMVKGTKLENKKGDLLKIAKQEPGKQKAAAKEIAKNAKPKEEKENDNPHAGMINELDDKWKKGIKKLKKSEYDWDIFEQITDLLEEIRVKIEG